MTKKITGVPELDNSAAFMMGLAYKQFRTLINQKVSTEFEITLEMFGVLRVLSHLGEIPQQTLAETLHRERSVTKRLVDNCIKRNLIEVHKSEINKKARYLALTEKGNITKKIVSKYIQQITTDYFSPLTSNEQQLLLKLSKKLIQDNIVLGHD
ncbi:MAG: MarR family transcriptional regulator [Moritella sp.]|uniref:MarR family winged helix-turn-helix transcriptional regulator n=1 Tax=Moritella sp. TaxID=78556 RepID=UPI0029BD8CD0|nr:MarR family transcriptional regulator [Moritella sp.]MDX2322236.1 MarR family transcriptional regulator [Moritella sp.]